MTLFQTLNKASFRGVTFLLDSHDVESGRKVVVHEYINKGKRFVEDLGGLPRSFTIKGFVSEPNYKFKRDALINALEKPGVGTLIHPFYGTVQVVAEPFTLTESMQRLGEATFSMVFREATENIYPTQSTANSSIIDQLSSSTLTDAATSMGQLWEVSDGFISNYENAKTQLSNLGDTFSSVVNPFDTASLASSQYRLNVSNFTSSITTNIKNPSALAGSVQELFTSLDNLSSEPRERWSIAKQFFTYGNTVVNPPPTTFKRQQLIRNNTALFSQVNFSSLANAYSAASQIDYTNENELNAIEQALNDQYFYCIDQTNLNTTAMNSLNSLRNQVRIYFESIRLNVKQLVNITTQQTTISALVYAYYNSLDNVKLILDINKLYNPENIRGNLQIVTDK
jgi:prophage DNA circulation protein